MTNYLKTTLFGLFLGAAAQSGFAEYSLNPISSIRNGEPIDLFDESAAEIVKYDRFTQQMYVVNGKDDAIDIFNISDPENPFLVRSVDLSAYGNPNSVDVNPRWFFNEIAVAVGSGEADVRGSVVFLNKAGDFIKSVEVGYLPDMLTYDSRGRRVVVANEAEPNDEYTFDPEGSVSIIQRRGWRGHSVFEVSLDGIAEDDLNGARISGPEGTSIAQDLEPEFVAIGPRDRFAYVACQENNAIVVVDLIRREVVDIFGLGFKDHSQIGNALDASNKDDGIRVANWPVKGLYMPDSIAAYSTGGQTYIVTANEGDGREYEFENGDGEDEISFTDESRVKDAILDESAFPLAEVLQEDENLGRIKFITTEGNLDDDEAYEELYTFGARSFSIFSTDGELVYDSGDFIETYLADELPNDFNSTNDESDSFDNRSDDKGPEPEAIEIATIGEASFVFVGLERVGGVMVFNITDPEAVSFVDYFNNRDFSISFDEDNLENFGLAGDLGPEGIDFVPAAQSPNGKPLVIVANEVSGTTTIFEFTQED